jgi:hypothetical protein
MTKESHNRLIELPDRNEITLCEAVTYFVYGKATDALQLLLDFAIEEDQAHNIKLSELLGRLQSAAYAGRMKFRGLKIGESPLNGHKDIDALYFGVGRGFNWRQDQIVNQDISDPVGEIATDWHDVHLNRNDFVALLQDLGVSVQTPPDGDTPGTRKTFSTGMPGRPTSKHLVLGMARHRLDSGDYPLTLELFSKQLAKELTRAEPEAVPMKPKTVANAVRELWRARRRPAEPAPSPD